MNNIQVGDVIIIGKPEKPGWQGLPTGIWHNNKWVCSKCKQTFDEILECECWPNLKSPICTCPTEQLIRKGCNCGGK